MSNALYPAAREGFLTGAIDWDTAVIKASLCRGYTYDAADVYVADLASVTQVATATIGSKTYTNGVAGSSATPTIDFSTVSAGAACDSIIIYQASAVTGGADVATSAQRVICFIDTLATGALSVTPNGSQITFTQDATNKLFTI